MKNITLAIAFLITYTFISCGGDSKSELGHNENQENSHAHEEGEGGEEEGHAEEGIVALTTEQAETIGLKMEPLEQRNLGNSIQVSGQLELFPQDKASVSPYVGGNVSSIRVVPGDNVRKGQILAYIEHPDIIAMQQELQEKNDELVFLKQDFERKKTLYDKGVTSGKDFQMAQSNYRATTSSVNGLKSKLKLLGINPSQVLQGRLFNSIPINSPISGYVDQVLIKLGDYVSPQSQMFSISDNSKVYVNLKVYEKDIKNIQKGQQIYFSTTSRPEELLTATVRSIGNTFETNPKAVEVIANIDNKDKNLLAGMYVKGRIVYGEKMGYAVPEEAIVRDADQFFIFILDESKKEKNKMSFKKIPVTTGVTDLGFTEINFGGEAPKNAKVVSNGSYNLSSEMVKGELEHSH